MRIWCGRILMSAYCTRIFGTGRRKRKGLRRTKSASSASGKRRAGHGARAFADGGTAPTPCKRDAGAESGRPLRSMRPPVRMDAQDYAGRKSGARSGGETFPANAPRATAGCIGPKAERTDAKSHASLSGRPEGNLPIGERGRRLAGCAFRAGVPLGRCSPQIRVRQTEQQSTFIFSFSRDATRPRHIRRASGARE